MTREMSNPLFTPHQKALARWLRITPPLPGEEKGIPPTAGLSEKQLEGLILTARREKVEPWLGWILTKDGVPHLSSLSPSQRDNLIREYKRTALYNAFLREISAELLRELRQVGVMAVPFKGIRSIDLLYPDDGLRIIEDIDIFISRNRAYSAISYLKERGWRVYWMGKITPLAINFYKRLREGRWGKIYLDLHLDLTHFEIFSEYPLESAVFRQRDDVYFLPHWEILLRILNVMASATSFTFFSIHPFIEIREYLIKYRNHWGEVEELFREFRLEPALALFLHLLEELYPGFLRAMGIKTTWNFTLPLAKLLLSKLKSYSEKSSKPRYAVPLSGIFLLNMYNFSLRRCAFAAEGLYNFLIDYLSDPI